MGLIARILAPWRAAEAMEEYHQGVAALLREIMVVTRTQAETTRAMQESLQQIGAMYATDGPPDRWVNDEDGQLLAEMLQRMATDEQGRGH